MTVEIRRAPYAGLACARGDRPGHVGCGRRPHLGRRPRARLARSGAARRASCSAAAGWCSAAASRARCCCPPVVAAQACLHTSFVTMAGRRGARRQRRRGRPVPWSGRMLLAHASVTLLTLLVWRLCERAAVAVLRLLTLPTSYAVGRPDRAPPTSRGHPPPRWPRAARRAAARTSGGARPRLTSAATGEAWRAPTHIPSPRRNPHVPSHPHAPARPRRRRRRRPRHRRPRRRPRQRPRLRHPVGDRRRRPTPCSP